MGRVFNFSAGPAAVPQEVLEQAQSEMLDWRGSGMSVMEMSHRGKDFVSISEKAEADLRELMAIPPDYKVMFLQGGASLQFAMIPMNILSGKASADYINTGAWSKKAIAEAKRFCEVGIAASTEAESFMRAPSQDELTLNPSAAYVHYTPNETIGGVEFSYVPETAGSPRPPASLSWPTCRPPSSPVPSTSRRSASSTPGRRRTSGPPGWRWLSSVRTSSAGPTGTWRPC
jgi:phosphoserine aminotransferase